MTGERVAPIVCDCGSEVFRIQQGECHGWTECFKCGMRLPLKTAHLTIYNEDMGGEK